MKRRSDSKNQLRKKKGLKGKKDKGKKEDKWWLWKPGQSGNPKGRPRKEVCVTSLIKQYLGEIADTRTGKTHEALLAEAIVAGAIKLHPTALKELLGRVDGSILERMKIDGSSRVEISIGDLARELAKRQKGKKNKKPRKSRDNRGRKNER